MFLSQFWLQCFLIAGICLYLLACGQDDRLLIKIGVNVPKTTAPTYTLMRQAMIDQANIYNAEELTEIKNDVDQGWVHFCNASHNIYGQPVDRKHLLGRQDIRFGRQKSEN